jgi:hypothetical protein
MIECHTTWQGRLMNNLLITSTGAGSCYLGHIGSVLDVIAGKMPESLDGKIFEAKNYLCGFLLASPQSKYSLGESIIVNNNCYTTSTDKSSSNYNSVIYGPKFLTSGMFLIPSQAKPSHRVSLNTATNPVPLLDFYNEIYKQVNQPLAFFGLIELPSFHAIAIGKPPIDGMNIFTNNKEYYPLPAVVEKNTHAFIIGALSNDRQSQYENINKQLEIVLYRTTHPGDTSGSPSLTNHAHALTLKQTIINVAAINSQLTRQILHMFPAGTTVANANLDIFTIKGLDNYQI